MSKQNKTTNNIDTARPNPRDSGNTPDKTNSVDEKAFKPDDEVKRKYPSSDDILGEAKATEQERPVQNRL